MISGVFSLPDVAGKGLWGDRQSQRIYHYIRLKRLYDGFAIRENTNHVIQWKTLRYNLARPVANIAAEFLASKPLGFTVSSQDELTKLADEIWTESGGGATFLENALLATVLGDACVMVVNEKDSKKGERIYLKWIDPSICFPDFDVHDYSRMTALIIAYDIMGADGKIYKYREEWKDGKCVTKVDDKVTEEYSYDASIFGGVPAVWIRNLQVKGDVFGRSDLQPIVETVEQYDHLMEKQSRIIDYYANPNIFVKGVSKGSSISTHGERSMYYLPENGDIGFIEWRGSPSGVVEHIDRVRETISELSETPQIAFSKLESGVNNVSGVALQMLYGPLLSKTLRKQMSWGMALEQAMAMALTVKSGKDVKPEDVSIEWPDPLPKNSIEEWEIYTAKNHLGVSKDQILREAGYTEEDIKQFKKESEEDQKSMGEHLLKEYNRMPQNNPKE